MGLDAVEIVMEVEEVFDIQIADEAAQRIVTVGDLFECIVEKVRFSGSGKMPYGSNVL